MNIAHRDRPWLASIATLAILLSACSASDSPSASAGASSGGGGGGGTADYPSEDLQIMTPDDPGGGWDNTARAMAPDLDVVF